MKSSHYDTKNKRMHIGVCGAEYAHHMLPKLLQQAMAMLEDGSARPWVFMYDADTKHKAGEVYRVDEHVRFMHDWGAQLTGVNPIENVCATVENGKHKRLPECRSVDGLLQVVGEECAKLNTTGVAQKTHASVRKRLLALIDATGGRTTY
jgi:hypothetical protein